MTLDQVRELRMKVDTLLDDARLTNARQLRFTLSDGIDLFNALSALSQRMQTEQAHALTVEVDMTGLPMVGD